MSEVALVAVTATGGAASVPEPLFEVDCDPLAAFAAPAVPLPGPEDPEHAEPEAAHHAIVEIDRALLALAAGTTVLPVRFGAVFSDVGSLRAAVVCETAGLLAALGRANGAREYRVEVSGEASRSGDPPEATTGREFLQRRRVDRDHRRGALDATSACLKDLEQTLAPLGHPRTWRPSGASGQACLALLAEPGKVPEILEVLALFQKRSRGRPVSLTGPWPLFSFEGGHLAPDL